MARKKTTREKPANQPSAPPSATAGGVGSGAKPMRGRIIAIALAVLAVAGAGWWIVDQGRAERDFLELAADGGAALTRIENPPSQGRGHLAPGQRVTYRSDPPTSGIHDRTWVEPGFYDQPQASTQLVHALEHGNIVIYYDRPGAGGLATLRGWTDLYRGRFSGVVAVARPGLDKKIILSAWKRILRQDTLDAAGAAAFIDKYRGRGPEHPVR